MLAVAHLFVFRGAYYRAATGRVYQYPTPEDFKPDLAYWADMGFRPKQRLYITVSEAKKRGIIVLSLIPFPRKYPEHRHLWVVVDGAVRLQVVNVSRKHTVRTRPLKKVAYDKVPVLTDQEIRSARDKAEALVKRMMAEAAAKNRDPTVAQKEEKQKRRQGLRSRLTTWLQYLGTSLISGFSSYRLLGAWGILMVILGHWMYLSGTLDPLFSAADYLKELFMVLMEPDAIVEGAESGGMALVEQTEAMVEAQRLRWLFSWQTPLIFFVVLIFIYEFYYRVWIDGPDPEALENGESDQTQLMLHDESQEGDDEEDDDGSILGSECESEDDRTQLRRELRDIRETLRNLKSGPSAEMTDAVAALRAGAEEAQKHILADAPQTPRRDGDAASTASTFASTPVGPLSPGDRHQASPQTLQAVDRQIEDMNKSLQEEKTEMKAKLKAFRPVVSWRPPGKSKIRLAPLVIPPLYKRDNASEEADRIIDTKDLHGSQWAHDFRNFGGLIDAHIREPGSDILNSEAGERLARSWKASIEALKFVLRREHWKQPKGQQGQKWKSKVDWKRFRMIDWESLARESDAIPELDDEIMDRMKQEALETKWASKSPDADSIFTVQE